MSPKGRIPESEDLRTGHRSAVGQGEAIEVLPVAAALRGIDPPEGMSAVAAEIWSICITDMAELGHLREPDLLLLRGYCETAGVMIEAAACIQEFGSMMQVPIIAKEPGIDEEGDLVWIDKVVGHSLKANPAVKQHGAAVDRLRLLSNELALNPLARIRGNLMEAATSSIALSVLSSLESKLDALDAKDAAKAAKSARKKPAAKAPAGKTPAKPPAKARKK